MSGKKRGEKIYLMRDFYLNFYFQVLQPLELQIKINRQELLFTQLLSKHGYHIVDFTGKAFELLCWSVLASAERRVGNIFDKLRIRTLSYDLFEYRSKKSQIDLVLESGLDRIVRLIECKWGQNVDPCWVQQICDKEYPLLQSYSRQNILLVAQTSAVLEAAGKSAKVEVLTLEDFLP